MSFALLTLSSVPVYASADDTEPKLTLPEQCTVYATERAEDFIHVERLEGSEKIDGWVEFRDLLPLNLPMCYLFAEGLPEGASVRARKEPSEDAEEITQVVIDHTTVIEVLSIEGPWAQINIDTVEEGSVWMRWMTGDSRVLLYPAMPTFYTLVRSLSCEGHYLRVRAEADTDSPEVAIIAGDMIVQGFLEHEGWLLVGLDDRSTMGWVSLRAVPGMEDSLQPVAVKDYQMSDKLPADCLLNVRRGPSCDEEVVGTFDSSRLIKVIDKEGEWYTVLYEHYGKTWVLASTQAFDLIVPSTAEHLSEDKSNLAQELGPAPTVIEETEVPSSGPSEENKLATEDRPITVEEETVDPGPKDAKELVAEEGLCEFYVSRFGNLSVRSAPSSTADTLGVVEKELILKVIEKKDRWLRILWEDSEEAWILSANARSCLLVFAEDQNLARGHWQEQEQRKAQGPQAGSSPAGLSQDENSEDRPLKPASFDDMPIGSSKASSPSLPFDDMPISSTSKASAPRTPFNDRPIASKASSQTTSAFDDIPLASTKPRAPSAFSDLSVASSKASPPPSYFDDMPIASSKGPVAGTTSLDDIPLASLKTTTPVSSKVKDGREGGSPFPPVAESAEKAPNQSMSEMMISKDWKTRKWAYASLKTLVEQEKNEASPLLMEYGPLLPKILKDNNISVVEVAVELTGAYLEKSELLNVLPIEAIVESLVAQGLGRKRPSLDARTCGILQGLLLSPSLPLAKVAASALSRGLSQNPRVVGFVFKVLTDVMEADKGRGLQLMQNTDELRANVMKALGSSKPEMKQVAFDFALKISEDGGVELARGLCVGLKRVQAQLEGAIEETHKRKQSTPQQEVLECAESGDEAVEDEHEEEEEVHDEEPEKEIVQELRPVAQSGIVAAPLDDDGTELVRPIFKTADANEREEKEVVETSEMPSGTEGLADDEGGEPKDRDKDISEDVWDSAETVINAAPSAIPVPSVQEDRMEGAFGLVKDRGSVDTPGEEQMTHSSAQVAASEEAQEAELEGSEVSEEAKASPGHEDVSDGEGKNMGELQEGKGKEEEAIPRRDSLDLLTDLLEDDEEGESFTLYAGMGEDDEMFMDFSGKSPWREQVKAGKGGGRGSEGYGSSSVVVSPDASKKEIAFFMTYIDSGLEDGEDFLLDDGDDGDAYGDFSCTSGGASSLKKAEPPGRSLPEWPSSAPVSLPKEMPAAKVYLRPTRPPPLAPPVSSERAPPVISQGGPPLTPPPSSEKAPPVMSQGAAPLPPPPSSEKAKPVVSQVVPPLAPPPPSSERLPLGISQGNLSASRATGPQPQVPKLSVVNQEVAPSLSNSLSGLDSPQPSPLSRSRLPRPKISNRLRSQPLSSSRHVAHDEGPA